MCKVIFKSKSDLDDHGKEHRKEITYLCDLCAKECSSDEDLNNHKLVKHPITETVEAPHSKEPTLENPPEDVSPSLIAKETLEYKRKLMIMEESYDRLMIMYQKQQSDAKDKALAFKVQIETITETTG